MCRISPKRMMALLNSGPSLLMTISINACKQNKIKHNFYMQFKYYSIVHIILSSTSN
jgi:hypothetical protein